MKTDPTVNVVDDDGAVRNSLRWLIESAGLDVATFASAKEFLNGYDRDRPGCLILDVRLPGQSGLDLQKQLAAQGVSLPVIIITGHGDVPIAVRAMRTGALDFIEKPFDDQVLLRRVRQAIDLDLRNRRERSERAGILGRLALLTPREREVLDRVVQGRANKQIAGDLGISTKTVEAHRAHVMEKMRAESLVELVHLVQSAEIGAPSLSAGDPVNQNRE
jgi:FixJ family two-component response regulator